MACIRYSRKGRKRWHLWNCWAIWKVWTRRTRRASWFSRRCRSRRHSWHWWHSRSRWIRYNIPLKLFWMKRVIAGLFILHRIRRHSWSSGHGWNQWNSRFPWNTWIARRTGCSGRGWRCRPSWSGGSCRNCRLEMILRFIRQHSTELKCFIRNSQVQVVHLDLRVHREPPEPQDVVE